MKHNEDALHKQIAQYLFYTIKNENDFWTYMPFGEKRNAITGALLKAKGTKRGVPDFMILKRNGNITNIIWIEVKYGKNKQSLEQIDFENKMINSENEKYYLVYNIDDVIKIFE